MSRRMLFVTVSALLVTGSAFAENDPNFKILINSGRATLDSGLSSTANYSVDEDDTSIGIGVLYSLNNNFSIEAGYQKFGEASITATNNLTETVYGSSVTINAGSKLSVNADGFNFGFIGETPVSESLSLYGKVGVLSWDADYNASGTIAVDGTNYSGSVDIFSDDGTDVYYGFGASYDISNDIGIGVEYVKYEIDDSDVDNVSAVLSVGF